MARPVLIYDGDCGFCRYWVERWKHVTRGRVDYEPSETAAPRFPAIPSQRFVESVVYVGSDGSVSYAAEAVFRALAQAPRGGLWLAAYRRVPGFRPLAEALYATVARNRFIFSRATRVLWGADPRPAEHRLLRTCVLGGIGVTYLIAFLSLWVQIDGLIGSNGVLPVAPWLDAVGRQLGSRAWVEAPTLLWLGASDKALHLVCAGGVVASLLLALNVVPAAAALAAWACYLSLFTAGRVFLGFQWDILLLEAGVIAILWAPWGRRPEIGRVHV